MFLHRLVHLIPTYLQLLHDVRRQQKFIRDHLIQDVEEARKNNDGTLDEEDFKKITSYYGFGVPAIVGEMFCTLRGEKMSIRERTCNTYQGALTGLVDDFFDKTGVENDQILEMISKPCTYEGHTSLEKLFTSFLCKVHQNIPDITYFKLITYKVLEDQTRSLEQKDALLSGEKLFLLSMDKGGHSLLFYRSAFGNPFVEGEKDAVYELGGLMQLGNDIFDVFRDSRDRIDTLLTVHKDLRKVRELFEQQYIKALKAAWEMDYPDKNKRRFIRKFIMGISRCFVCLDQLYELQQKNNMKFEPMKFSRNDLICDMEKPKNILSFLTYYLVK